MTGGIRVAHAVAAAAVVLASQAGDASCNVTPWACREDTRGIRVEQGVVTDVITVTCDEPRPRTHTLDAWIEYSSDSDEKWRRAGEVETTSAIPDADGLPLHIEAWECVSGQYRAAWRVNGTSGDPGETLFSRKGGDWSGTPVSADEC